MKIVAVCPECREQHPTLGCKRCHQRCMDGRKLQNEHFETMFKEREALKAYIKKLEQFAYRKLDESKIPKKAATEWMAKNRPSIALERLADILR